MSVILKKAKKKNKNAILFSGLIGCIIALTCNYVRTNMETSGLIACIIFGLITSFIVYYQFLIYIWIDVQQYKNFLKRERSDNHARLIQNSLNIDDKINSRELINSFNDAKYGDKVTFALFKGIWIGKYCEVIDVVNN